MNGVARPMAMVRPSGLRPAAGLWPRLGEWLRTHQRAIRRMQWGVVAVYVVLLVVPATLPLPERSAHLWDHLTLIAQFVFWGLWWPFVLLSVVLLGRAWCGLLCPEGALSEFASRHGRGRAVPRWIRWGGWPFVAFAATTVYGQMVSVYQYPAPALLVLGGSTAAAMVVGYLYGRGKRVWCRYLCPVSGVFALLAKLAPLHYRVDEAAWREATRAAGSFRPLNCAPMVPIPTMKGAADCHMCGRCSGFRDAVALSPRRPGREIVDPGPVRPWETALVLYGLLGIALGAFHWSASPTLVRIKQALAGWLVDRGMLWPLERSAPWWVLTSYSERNDVLSLADGVLLVGYVLGVAVPMGTALSAGLALAAAASGWSRQRFHHLAQALVPLAGCGVFLGLSAQTVTMLRAEGVVVPGLAAIRAGLLIGAWAWSLGLAWRILSDGDVRGLRRAASAGPFAATAAGAGLAWAALFWP